MSLIDCGYSGGIRLLLVELRQSLGTSPAIQNSRFAAEGSEATDRFMTSHIISWTKRRDVSCIGVFMDSFSIHVIEFRLLPFRGAGKSHLKAVNFYRASQRDLNSIVKAERKTLGNSKTVKRSSNRGH
jgi:hypothetical protein